MTLLHILVKSEGHAERKYVEMADGLGISFRNVTIGSETAVFFDLSFDPEKREILLFFMVDFISMVDDKGSEKAFLQHLINGGNIGLVKSHALQKKGKEGS